LFRYNYRMTHSIRMAVRVKVGSRMDISYNRVGDDGRSREFDKKSARRSWSTRKR
jgi:hypothetical protein